MKRRTYLKTMLAVAGAAVTPAVAELIAAPAAGRGHPNELHCNLQVDPAKEEEMLRFFETRFRPAAAKQPGYVDMKMLKLVSTLRGPAPPESNYQFILTFTSAEMRQRWAATAIHKKLWPVIEATLLNKNYSRLMYEVY